MNIIKLEPVYLEPLQKLKKLNQESFGAWDCETKDGLLGQKLLVHNLGINDKRLNRKTQYHKQLTILTEMEKVDNLFRFLKPKEDSERKNFTVIFVHNLGFDVRFLIKYCLLNQIEHKPILSGSRFLGLSINEYKVRFVDTVQFLFSSQEVAEINYNVPLEYRKEKHSGQEQFNKKFEEWSDEDLTEVLEHGKNDIIALHYIMKEFRKTMFDLTQMDMLYSVSLASFALKSYRASIDFKIFNPFVSKLIDEKGFSYTMIENQRKLFDFVKIGYFGGITEPHDMNPIKNCVYCDKVSLYPSVMEREKYPFGKPYEIGNKDVYLDCVKDRYVLKNQNLTQIWKNETNCRFINRKIEDSIFKKEHLGMVLCAYKIPEKHHDKNLHPVLPMREDMKIKFKCLDEWQYGVFATPEIKYAKERGYEFKFFYALFYSEKKHIFKKFINKFFKFKSEHYGAKRQGSKITMNSSYGKFGEDRIRHEFDYKFYLTEDMALTDLEENDIELEYSEELDMYYSYKLYDKENVRAHQNPIIAAFTTCYARLDEIKGIHELEQMGIDCKYCDTDSIVFERKYLKIEINRKIYPYLFKEERKIKDGNKVKKVLIVYHYLDEHNKEKEIVKIEQNYLENDKIITKNYENVKIFAQNGKGQKRFYLSNDLGGWDIEHDFKYFHAFAPKCYVVQFNNNEILVKIKGANRGTIKDIIKQSKNYENPIEFIEKRIRKEIAEKPRYETFKSAIRKGEILSVRQMKKTFTFEYDKRIVLENGSTRPIGYKGMKLK